MLFLSLQTAEKNMYYVVKAQKNDLVKVVHGESSPSWNLQQWKGFIRKSMLTGLASLIDTGQCCSLDQILRRLPQEETEALRFSPSDRHQPEHEPMFCGSQAVKIKTANAKFG